jgi:stage V sporulation protein B
VKKALEMGKTSATGSFQLLIGVALSTMIMAVGSIILGRLMTTDEYGLYNIALAPSILINLFRDWGINSAMTKYVASLRASNSEEEIHDFMVAGLIFEVVSGVALSFLSLFLATFIASYYQKPESGSYIATVSVSIISGSLLAASQAGFIGYERMELNSFTLICQAIVKTAVGPMLIFLGYSVLGAVIGYDMGFVAAGVIGLAVFYFILLRPLRKKRTKNSNMTKTFKTMLNYGVPLSIGSILAGILTQIYAFMIIPLTSKALYGNYVVALNFTVLLTFLTTPIATVLFPAFAKLDPQNEDELVKNVFASSIKYTSILLVPATMILMSLSSPIVGALYGQKYVYGPFFLTIAVIGNLFALLGSLSAGSLLSGLGQTRILMIQSIITIVIGLPLGFLLIPTLGITGLIIANITAGVPSMLWALNWIWKHYKTKADFHSSAKIFASSTLAAIPAYLTATFMHKFFEHTVRYYAWPALKKTVHHTALLFRAHAGQILVRYTTVRAYVPWIELGLGLIVFLAIYILGAPIIGAVTQSDIDALRHMFSNLGIVSKIINIPLKAAEKAAEAKSPNRKAGEKP